LATDQYQRERDFVPALKKSAIRKIRLHDLRHTFGSLLIQGGASLAYVRDQMGHSSIQITVDVYGHLVAGADISWVDRLGDRVKSGHT
jgi:integrase